MERFISAGKFEANLIKLPLDMRGVVRDLIAEEPTADVVPVVRCKDCKHRPTDTGGQGDGFDMEFPDNVCPCQVEDPYYSWVPKDNWFCPDGERKDDG